jgi:hypothetical protein
MNWQAVSGLPSTVVSPVALVQIRSRNTGFCASIFVRVPEHT